MGWKVHLNPMPLNTKFIFKRYQRLNPNTSSWTSIDLEDLIMNPELWEKPYEWKEEKSEIRWKVKTWLASLQSGKRIKHDPFNDVSKIRCIAPGCKIQYVIPDLSKHDLSSWRSLKECLTILANCDHSIHIFRELGIANHYNGIEVLFQHGKSMHICKKCQSNSPFPIGPSQTWVHDCKDWILKLNKPNHMRWVSSAWVLEIDFVTELWRTLRFKEKDNLGVRFDPKAIAFLVSDSAAPEVVKLCKTAIPTFKQLPKPAPRPNTAMAVSKKSKAAIQILESLPPETLKKVYRLICLELHPDKNPQNLKAMQEFQEAWNLWESAK